MTASKSGGVNKHLTMNWLRVHDLTVKVGVWLKAVEMETTLVQTCW